jgi:tRNA-2-methylthio-N6-dimethylallyladenosine synthase
MNVHDSERIAGLLDAAGHIPVAEGDQADIVVFNTCAVRENADNKLYGNLSFLAPIKKASPSMQIAVGGCLAQKDQTTILSKAPYVDVVFGTHNVGSLPVLLERARIEEESQIEILEALEHFPSTLPARRFSAFTSWVSISVGCNNTCTFCIVPALRGAEKDRTPADILAEARALVEQGVIEITLLGQNVNAYGVEAGQKGAFAQLLRDMGRIEGLERIRFMSPHPRDFTDDVIEAMVDVPTVMPHLHMPLQSGSDSILQAMRRSYRSEKYLGILDRVRTAMPHAMITTDIIVGFPGETEEDFQATMDLVSKAEFAAAYTYKYSIRPGTPAGAMENQVDEAVVGERYTRLHEHLQKISLSINQRTVGTTHRALVSENEENRGRITGRTEDFRLVHFNHLEGVRPGDFVDVVIEEASAHYLLGRAVTHIPTRGGDAYAARTAPSGPTPTNLGIPTLKKKS